MMNVTAHLRMYGPNGVPKGFVDTQNDVKGNTPCLERTRHQLALQRPRDLQLHREVRMHSNLPSDLADDSGLAD